MMAEAGKDPETQGGEVDRAQEIRNALNDIILGKNPYDGRVLERGILGLQTALLGKGVPPEKAYAELAVFAGQAIEKADMNGDTETADALRESKEGFDAAENALKPRKAGRPRKSAGPTPTQTLPPMTRAKGRNS